MKKRKKIVLRQKMSVKKRKSVECAPLAIRKGMKSWFSDQWDRAFLFESNDMLQEIFPVMSNRVSVKIKYKLKQDYFYQLSKEDSIPSKAKKKSDFQPKEVKN